MRFNPTPVRSTLHSPWGPMTLAAHDTALVWVGFDGQKHEVGTQAWRLAPGHTLLRQTADQLQQYFVGERRDFDIALDLSCGTPFQQRVWNALLAIGHGQTCSYGAISQTLGQPSAMRAVGGAVGRNPISILVPCHRVLGAGGCLTGYAGGLERKIALLELERRP